MIRKLLIAYDGRPGAEEVFAFGLDLAKKYDADVELMSVAQPPEPPTVVEVTAVLENATEHFEGQFKDLKKRAKKEGVRLVTSVLVGHPAQQILHRAEQQQHDAIVMGHRSHGLWGRWFLGSVADRVLDHARCTVIVVKSRDGRSGEGGP